MASMNAGISIINRTKNIQIRIMSGEGKENVQVAEASSSKSDKEEKEPNLGDSEEAEELDDIFEEVKEPDGEEKEVEEIHLKKSQQSPSSRMTSEWKSRSTSQPPDDEEIIIAREPKHVNFVDEKDEQIVDVPMRPSRQKQGGNDKKMEILRILAAESVANLLFGFFALSANVIRILEWNLNLKNFQEMLRQNNANVNVTSLGDVFENSHTYQDVSLVSICCGLGYALGLWICPLSQINSMTTFSFALLRLISCNRLPCHWAGQIFGCLIASLLVYAINLNLFHSIGGLNNFSIALAFSEYPAFPSQGVIPLALDQFIRTFILCMISIGFQDSRIVDSAKQSNLIPIILGSTLAALMLCTSATTFPMMHPMMEISTRLVMAILVGRKVYEEYNYFFLIPMLVPFVGAITSVVIFKFGILKLLPRLEKQSVVDGLIREDDILEYQNSTKAVNKATNTLKDLGGVCWDVKEFLRREPRDECPVKEVRVFDGRRDHREATRRLSERLQSREKDGQGLVDDKNIKINVAEVNESYNPPWPPKGRGKRLIERGSDMPPFRLQELEEILKLLKERPAPSDKPLTPATTQQPYSATNYECQCCSSSSSSSSSSEEQYVINKTRYVEPGSQPQQQTINISCGGYEDEMYDDYLPDVWAAATLGQAKMQKKHPKPFPASTFPRVAPSRVRAAAPGNRPPSLPYPSRPPFPVHHCK